MARLANVAAMGFYALPGTKQQPNMVAEMIASMISVPADARFGDLVAGEFVAGAAMCNAWGLPWENRYANELDSIRYQTILELFQKNTDQPNVLNANTLQTLQVSREMFSVLYSNPPFDNVEEIHGGGRLEPEFFKRIDHGAWIQPGGIHILVSPKYVFQRQDMVSFVGKTLDKVRFYALPEEVGPYAGAIVVIGVVRAGRPTHTELVRRIEIIQSRLKENLATLSFVPAPIYTAPSALPLKKLVWRDRSLRNPQVAVRDIVRTGGAWASKKYRDSQKRLAMGTARISPLFPLSPAQAAMRVANGDVNDRVIDIASSHRRIKGTTMRSTQKWVEYQKNGDTEIEIKHQISTEVPVVSLVDQATGHVHLFQNNEGLQALFELSGARDGIISAIEGACPPVYGGKPLPEIEESIRTARPTSGRALPGYSSGLIPMQQHMVAAIYQAMTQPHRVTGAAPLKNSMLSAQMGSGKTGCAAVIAKLFHERKQRLEPGTPTLMIVSGPGHVIGDRAGLTEYDDAIANGKTPKAALEDLAPHVFEFRDWIPDAHVEIVESPSQLSALVRKAQPGKLTIGMISVSKMSLASGREIGFSRRERSLPNHPTIHQWSEYFYNEHEREIESRNKKKKNERTYDANDTQEVTRQLPAGVSERTLRRDRMFRAGIEGGVSLLRRGKEETRTVFDPYLGLDREVTTTRFSLPEVECGIPRLRIPGMLYCTRCGEALYNEKGEFHTEKSALAAGLNQSRGSCLTCGDIFGQVNRRFDSVQDRELIIFQEGSWRTKHPDIPWGERPASNPRMPLGEFLARRYKGVFDLVIADEAHMYAGAASDRGDVFAQLVAASKNTLAMTGTIYGGLASTAFHLLQRLRSRTLSMYYDYNELTRFVEELGVVDYVTRTYTSESDAKAVSGKSKVINQKVEKPGITARLAAIIQEIAVITLLKQMGFRLASYEEEVVALDLPGSILNEYKRLLSEGVAIIKEPGGKDALSSYLQAALSYCMAPWKPMVISSKKAGSYAPPVLDDQDMPHHLWVADYLVEQKRLGRRCLFFVQHTNKLDLLHDLQEKVTRLAKERHNVDVSIELLRSTTVKPTRRMAWFKQQEKAGADAVFCHPKLVETGVNLIGWPEIIFVEPSYSLFTDDQAKKRAWRPTQTKACKVTRLCYNDTMTLQAIGHIGRKAASSALLAGDELTNSFLVFDQGMSLLQMLSKQVQGAMPPASLADVQAAVKAASRAVVESETHEQLVGLELLEEAILQEAEQIIEEARCGTPVEEDFEDKFIAVAELVRAKRLKRINTISADVYQGVLF